MKVGALLLFAAGTACSKPEPMWQCETPGHLYRRCEDTCMWGTCEPRRQAYCRWDPGRGSNLCYVTLEDCDELRIVAGFVSPCHLWTVKEIAEGADGPTRTQGWEQLIH